MIRNYFELVSQGQRLTQTMPAADKINLITNYKQDLEEFLRTGKNKRGAKQRAAAKARKTVEDLRREETKRWQ